MSTTITATQPEEVLTPQERNSIEEALQEYARGKFLIMSDDEDRENEGDLILSAQYVTPEAINFMITYGKGLVCIAIDEKIARRLDLKPMVQRNNDPMGTAFTVSIDAGPEHGITTGISAWDRAKTIELMMDESTPKEAFRAPGHMFPLVAKPGGVLQRQGHTEAAVTLSRLVGHKPAGIIVEIIKENGEMARRDDLMAMAETWGIKYITIRNLVKYCSYLNELELGEEIKNLRPISNFLATE